MFWYNGNVAYDKGLVAKIKVTALLGLLQYRFIYKDDIGSGLFLLGFKIKDSKKVIDEALNDSEDIDEGTSEKTVSTESGDLKNKSLKEKLNEIKDFIKDKENLAVIKSVYNVIVKLLKHVFPKKIKGRIEYGLDDPYATAKVLEFFALLYSFMGDDLTVIPLWNELKLECNLSFSGRISVIYSLFQICKLRFNKNCMRLWRKYHGK